MIEMWKIGFLAKHQNSPFESAKLHRKHFSRLISPTENPVRFENADYFSTCHGKIRYILGREKHHQKKFNSIFRGKDIRIHFVEILHGQYLTMHNMAQTDNQRKKILYIEMFLMFDLEENKLNYGTIKRNYKYKNIKRFYTNFNWSNSTDI